MKTDQNQNDEQDSPAESEEEQERQEYQQMMDRNYEKLQELEHRKIEIRSNRYEKEDREYYVEEVEKAYLDGGSGYIPSVRLKNEGVRPSLQPVLKMPRNPIPKEEGDEVTTLKLIYTKEPSVEHSFQFMNHRERPDLKIFISYQS